MSPVRHLAILLATMAPAAAWAQDLATGDAIRAAISGNTLESSLFIEFYAEDGTLRSHDFTGTWQVNGDAVCFDDGTPPICFDARIDGPAVTWVQDGVDGITMTILPGNPYGL